MATYTTILANEARAAYKDRKDALLDRQLFVLNLGVLLSQTREGIERAYLDNEEQVHVVYKGGHEELVNVDCDSYMAIIRDVTRRL